MRLSERQRWQRTRQKGMPRYVLVNGILIWGAPMFLLMTFVFKYSDLPIWQSATLWILTGIAYGITTWVTQERRYRKAATEHRG